MPPGPPTVANGIEASCVVPAALSVTELAPLVPLAVRAPTWPGPEISVVVSSSSSAAVKPVIALFEMAPNCAFRTGPSGTRWRWRVQ